MRHRLLLMRRRAQRLFRAGELDEAVVVVGSEDLDAFGTHGRVRPPELDWKGTPKIRRPNDHASMLRAPQGAPRATCALRHSDGTPYRKTSYHIARGFGSGILEGPWNNC